MVSSFLSPLLFALTWLSAPGFAGDLLAPEARMPADPAAWSRLTTPKEGPPQVFGGYSAGCLQGAAALPQLGPGYQVTRPKRRRTFGHPALLEYLRRLGRAASRAPLGPLMIGDLGQPRGGPAPTGHASHQTGLDVDVWYVAPPEARRRKLSQAERNRLEATAVVDLATKQATAAWRPSMVRLLELAATDPEVDRIFVHARVKQLACQARTTNRAWLAKLRPWWGHHDHFHVRLRCPQDSPACEAQPALGPDPGCDKLDWWFSEDSLQTLVRRKAEKAKAEPTLPAACRDVLDAVPGTVVENDEGGGKSAR